MPPTTKVLIYGRDARLLETRQLILQGAGFAVTATESMDEAKQTLDTQVPTVLILCQTLLPDESKAILETAHAKPRVTTLLIEGSEPVSRTGKKDDVLTRYRSPKDLISAVTRLAEQAESATTGS